MCSLPSEHLSYIWKGYKRKQNISDKPKTNTVENRNMWSSDHAVLDR